jgi:hypothetical protein
MKEDFSGDMDSEQKS